MPRRENCVLTNMCMVYDDCGNILVQDRLDENWPGITFPGGHVEAEESFVRSVIREVKEETGLEIANLELCGLKQFTHRTEGYRYVVIFYRTKCFKGELKSSAEGKVFWIKRSELDNYTLADGFKEMIEVFESDSLTENYHWYDNGWREKNM